MKRSLIFLVFCLFLTPVAAYSVDNPAILSNVQQAQIQKLEQQVAALQKQLNDLSSKLKAEYSTTKEVNSLSSNLTQIQNTYVSKSAFASILAENTGISCDGRVCSIKRFLRLSPPGLGRDLHIPESWGSNQPYVYCDATNCYALLRW
jgi:uncharacterized protein YlxW (UPF0749 family)